MLTEIDIIQMPSYEIGLEKGIEKGEEKGLRRGAAAEKRRAARSLLGLLDDAVIAERLGLDIDEVRALHSSDGDET